MFGDMYDELELYKLRPRRHQIKDFPPCQRARNTAQGLDFIPVIRCTRGNVDTGFCR